MNISNKVYTHGIEGMHQLHKIINIHCSRSFFRKVNTLEYINYQFLNGELLRQHFFL
uniref:Uncharacterized protein n=1 Tax=Lepeophtheirus salmonis TaxID=72036 RepID=A0A0K2T1X9_LEPSM